MLKITNTLFIQMSEVQLTAVRSQGAGGQNVNKVSTAIHLRFDVMHSDLPIEYKNKLLQLSDYRVTTDGIIIIKAQRYKSQEQNKADALQRLVKLIKKAGFTPKKRRETKPSKSAVWVRLDNKKLRGNLKKLRQTLE